MDFERRTPLWLNVALAAFCVGLVVLSLWDAGTGPTLPAVACLGLGAAFALASYYAPDEWPWRHWLYVPAATLAAFGLVFLFNVFTGDWGAWAYAWLLCLGAAGLGLAWTAAEARRTAAPGTVEWRHLSVDQRDLPAAQRTWPLLCHIGSWVAVGSLAAFFVFGAIASGPFIRAVAVVLLTATATALGLRAWRRARSQRGRALQAGTASPAASSQAPAANSALIEPLSARELEVLALIESGLSNAEIADRLVVAQSTVKTHINSIYGKLGAKSRTDALHRAKELGLL